MGQQRDNPDAKTVLATLVGRRIAAARIRAGLTLRELSAKVGLAHSTLANYEAGRRPLRLDQFIAIAHALHCSPAALLVEPPEAASVVSQLDGNLERALQVRYILDTLELPEAEL